MTVRAAPMPRHSPAWRAWLHFVGLAVLAGAVEVLALANGGVEAGELRAALPGFYYGILPVLAAISVGMLGFNASVARQAVLLAVVSMLAMVVLDFAPPKVAGLETPALTLDGGAIQGRHLASDLHPGGALRTIMRFVRGDLVLGSERPAQYPADHPRLLATVAAADAGELLFPIILMGMVLGLQAWVAERVTFRTSWDGHLARVLLSWVVAPATFLLIVGWVHRIQVQVLFGDSGLPSMFLPYVPFALIAAIGWVTAWRASRWAAG